MLDYRTSSSPDRPPKPLSERLREETRADHSRAEKHALMAAMIGGRIDRAAYAGYLGQMLHVHATLEAALRDTAHHHPALALVVREHEFRELALLADLSTLGECPDRHARLPATALFCGRIAGLAGEAPVALLGTLYVLEGSTNGGRYLAPAVRKALGLPGHGEAGSGTEYLDPHGPRQRARWGFFKTSLDVLALAPAERDLIVAVASDAFRGVHDIFEDLTHPASAQVVFPIGGRTAGAANGTLHTPAAAHLCVHRGAEKEGRTPHHT
ncbi:MAG: biliverdin-producing heme oxygenase [Planctomycetes bacterium]|nr:biliverdin-producing heme oxygenase [Planctomycetota bacterium]